MSIFQRHPKDHVALWFEQRRKLGVSDDIYWGRYTPHTSEQEEALKVDIFQHANGDGMSIMKHMLNDLGYTSVKIPKCRETGEPDTQELKAIKAKVQPYPKRVKWRFWKADNQVSQNSVDTLFFDRYETAAIEQRAKSLDIPLTTFILWALNRSAAKHLLADSKNCNQSYSWFYPVNLRGAANFGTDSDYANFSSGFYIPLEADISPTQLNDRIRERLKSREHWLHWQQAKIAKYLPGFMIRFLYRYLSNKSFYAGNFSAMGNWLDEDTSALPSKQAEAVSALQKERWFCCAPGTKNYPISSCVMKWNGQLGLTLKLHSSIVKDDKVSLETLCDWGNELFEDNLFDINSAVGRNQIVSYKYTNHCQGI